MCGDGNAKACVSTRATVSRRCTRLCSYRYRVTIRHSRVLWVRALRYCRAIQKCLIHPFHRFTSRLTEGDMRGEEPWCNGSALCPGKVAIIPRCSPFFTSQSPILHPLASRCGHGNEATVLAWRWTLSALSARPVWQRLKARGTVHCCSVGLQ